TPIRKRPSRRPGEAPGNPRRRKKWVPERVPGREGDLPKPVTASRDTFRDASIPFVKYLFFEKIWLPNAGGVVMLLNFPKRFFSAGLKSSQPRGLETGERIPPLSGPLNCTNSFGFPGIAPTRGARLDLEREMERC